MKAISFWIIFVLFLVNFSLAKCNISNNSLIFVVELFRHGILTKYFHILKGQEQIHGIRLSHLQIGLTIKTMS